MKYTIETLTKLVEETPRIKIGDTFEIGSAAEITVTGIGHYISLDFSPACGLFGLGELKKAAQVLELLAQYQDDDE